MDEIESLTEIQRLLMMVARLRGLRGPVRLLVAASPDIISNLMPDA
jgi:hypothetical protein